MRKATKPPPGIVEALKSTTAALESATILLKAVQAVEREPVAPNATDVSRVDDECAFDRAYSRWLAALAKWHNPDGINDETGKKRAEELKRAEREFIFTPAGHIRHGLGENPVSYDLPGRRTPPWPTG